MLCSNCGSPRTRYVKTLNKASSSFSNEKLVQERMESIDLYRCTTCGSTFHFKK